MCFLAALAIADVEIALDTPYVEPVRIPYNGDLAYTRYRGEEYVGHLADIQGEHPRFAGKIVADVGKDFWPGQTYLFVGYDERIVWDANRHMWHAPADWD